MSWGTQRGATRIRIRHTHAILHTNLKALRMCCRGFGELGAKYLFEELWVHMNETSFANMTAIAEHPIYSHMVHELKIFPRLLTKFYFNGSYEREVRSRLRRIEANDVRTSCALSAKEMDNAYKRYKDIWEGEDGLSGKIQTKLLHAMNKFPQLHSITSGVWQDFIQSELRRVATVGKDPLLETTLMLPGLSWARLNYRHEGAHTSTVTKSIMRAIASSRPVFAGMLHRAGVFSSFTIDYTKLSARDLKLVKRLVSCLTCFELHIQNNKHKNTPDNPAIFREVLGWCNPNLQELSIVDSRWSRFYSEPVNAPHALKLVFGDTHWRRLSSLSLKQFAVDGDTLITILRRHKSTLKQLFMSDMLLLSASWQKSFTELQGGVLALIDFQGLHVSDVWTVALGYVGDDNASWDVMQKGLHSFIVDKQPWPSDILPAGLSRHIDDQPGDED